MIYILIILYFVTEHMKQRIADADAGKKVEVMPSFRETCSFLELIFLIRYNNNCLSCSLVCI